MKRLKKIIKKIVLAIWILILGSVVLGFGAVVYFCAVVHQRETQVYEIGQHLAALSEAEWQEAFRSAESYYLQNRVNDSELNQTLYKATLPKPLQDLGFEKGWMNSSGVHFGVGGGFSTNSAYASFILHADTGENRRVEFRARQKHGFINAAN